MYFKHAPAIWEMFPELVPGTLFISGITPNPDPSAQVASHTREAATRLQGITESELPEIQAWRRAFSRMGLKPTQYRCAAESLLRRFRKEGSLPGIHPLIDLCNAVSLEFATPIAVIDIAQVAGGIEVRQAEGNENYQTFGGDIEHPEPDEVIFADEVAHAHARRWCHRQSGLSAVSPATSQALIVAEAMHEGASEDIARLLQTLAEDLKAIWGTSPTSSILTPDAPEFTFQPST